MLKVRDVERARDLSLPIRFGEANSRAFGLAPAHTNAVAAGSFVGDVRRGGSCNCEVHTLTPHADGTHTEGPGHLTAARHPVRIKTPLCVAALVHITPRPLGEIDDDVSGNHRHDDLVIAANDLEDALAGMNIDGEDAPTALVIKSGPRDDARRFSGTNPPYLTVDAALFIRARGFRHLLVDLPSIDREDDGGILGAHRAFFNLPKSGDDTHVEDDVTITELCAIDDDLAAGLYTLLLMTVAIEADAVPSRPLLMPLSR